MNKSTVERLTGCEVVKIGPREWKLLYQPPLTGTGHKEKDVLQDLHDKFWKIRKTEVFIRDGHKCVVCCSPFHIECDHIVNRSQGGTHDPSNLQTLCNNCHSAKTWLKGRWAKNA